MESPLRYTDQDDEIKSQFDLILSAIWRINGNSSEEDVRALDDRIQREVTAKPILARIVLGYDSLLSVTCVRSNKLVHPAIKCLIKANPSALLWETSTDTRVIHDVANHPSHCVLMPWIATNNQWVLSHDICLELPPVFTMLYQYINRGVETGCTAAIIQQFLESFPRGLTQVDEDGDIPLHIILRGTVECEVDLFTWMAEQCPSTMLKADNARNTPLHYACCSFRQHRGYNSRSEICKYLIKQCPESVRVLNDDKRLPIHLLLDYCQHRPVKEVVVCLLRVYPESYDMATAAVPRGYVRPRYIPFIQRIKPLLDEERELKENVAYLQDVAGLFRDAVEGTQTPISLASSTCDAFVNWASLTSVQRLEAKMEHISKQLKHECNVG